MMAVFLLPMTPHHIWSFAVLTSPGVWLLYVHVPTIHEFYRYAEVIDYYYDQILSFVSYHNYSMYIIQSHDIFIHTASV